MEIKSATLDFNTDTLTVRLYAAHDVYQAYERIISEPTPAVAETRNVTVEDIRYVIKALYRGNGNRIAAIKLYRTVSGLGLREAKEECDRIGSDPGPY